MEGRSNNTDSNLKQEVSPSEANMHTKIAKKIETLAPAFSEPLPPYLQRLRGIQLATKCGFRAPVRES